VIRRNPARKPPRDRDECLSFEISEDAQVLAAVAEGAGILADDVCAGHARFLLDLECGIGRWIGSRLAVEERSRRGGRFNQNHSGCEPGRNGHRQDCGQPMRRHHRETCREQNHRKCQVHRNLQRSGA
jgi:hypothetical protein